MEFVYQAAKIRGGVYYVYIRAVIPGTKSRK